MGIIHLNCACTKTSVQDPSATTRSPTGYPIVFASIDSLGEEMEKAGLRPSNCLLITDEHVDDLYGQRMATLLRDCGWIPQAHVLAPGEQSKSASTLGHLYDWALGLGVERKTPVIAFGGGVVGDLAGFFAATLLRGVPLVHIPTTLVSQVDSSIGGKTGINHTAGKNLIGAFYRPQLVLSDTRLLDSLPDVEWRSGLAEAVKHALIADAELFTAMESIWPELISGTAAIGNLVERSAAVKIRTVTEDEHEAGKRMLLNFGHTFGHALERVSGYGAVTHGQAVAAGMIAATLLSVTFHDRIDVDRIVHPLRDLVPPTWHSITGEQIVKAMQSDKKRSSSALRLVLLERIGSAYVREDVDNEQIARAFEQAKAVTQG